MRITRERYTFAHAFFLFFVVPVFPPCWPKGGRLKTVSVLMWSARRRSTLCWSEVRGEYTAEVHRYTYIHMCVYIYVFIYFIFIHKHACICVYTYSRIAHSSVDVKSGHRFRTRHEPYIYIIPSLLPHPSNQSTLRTFTGSSRPIPCTTSRPLTARGFFFWPQFS